MSGWPFQSGFLLEKQVIITGAKCGFMVEADRRECIFCLYIFLCDHPIISNHFSLGKV